MPVRECLAGSQWIWRNETTTSDRVCANATVCNTTSQWEMIPISRYDDRVCAATTQCNFITNDGVPIGGEYMSAPPTATTDRVCLSIRPACLNGTQYQPRAPTLTSDRVCTPYSAPCTAQQYESAPNTPTSDHVCSPRTVCASGRYTVSGGPSTDDTCAPCDFCRPFPYQYQSLPCAGGLNRVCSNISTCDVYSQYMLYEATATTDRVCVPATVCDEDQSEWVTLSATSDRMCGSGPRPACDCNTTSGTGSQYEVWGSSTLYSLPTCVNRTAVPDGFYEPTSSRTAPGFCYNDTRGIRPCAYSSVDLTKRAKGLNIGLCFNGCISHQRYLPHLNPLFVILSLYIITGRLSLSR